MKRVLFILFLSFSFTATLLVPEEYPAIQEAIDYSIDGDTILVSVGTYYENINFGSKKISVIGEDKQSTIIDGNYSGSVVTFNGSGISEALLSGFTIIHGSSSDGGGIYCTSSSPIIQNNIIIDNISETYGGGISCNYSSAKIVDNIITQNSALYGGGISFDRYTSSIIEKNTIINNYAENGGGIGCSVFSSPFITNNTIANNSASATGGGIYCYYGSSAIVTNTIVWDNDAPDASNISVYSSNPIITYSNIMDGWEGEGNINQDPLFSDSNNYELDPDSPCIDSGTSDIDNDGFDDILDYHGNSPDIGAFEYGHWVILNSYPIPEGASGLAYDGNYIYFGIYGSDGNHIYRFNLESGEYNLIFESNILEDAFGLTSDGEYLWSIKQIGFSDPAIAVQLDDNGEAMNQIILPDHYMSGIAFHNENFWVSTYYPDPGRIYYVDSSGNILNEIPSPDSQPWDISLGDMGLWIADYWGDRIYNINEYDGTIINSYPSEGVDPSGVVWDGTNIWYCDNGINYDTDLIYKVEISTNVDAGDINDDGVINILDVIIIVNLVLNNQYENNADLNDDNILNVQDVIILINIILGN